MGLQWGGPPPPGVGIGGGLHGSSFGCRAAASGAPGGVAAQGLGCTAPPGGGVAVGGAPPPGVGIGGRGWVARQLVRHYKMSNG